MKYDALQHFINYWKVKLAPFFDQNRIDNLFHGYCTENLFFSQDKTISDLDLLSVQSVAVFIYGEEKTIAEINASFILSSDYLRILFDQANSQLIENFEALESWAIKTNSLLEVLKNEAYFNSKVNEIIDLDNFSHNDLYNLSNDIIDNQDHKKIICDYFKSNKPKSKEITNKLKQHLLNKIKNPEQLSYYSLKMISENQLLIQSYDQLNKFNLYYR